MHRNPLRHELPCRTCARVWLDTPRRATA
jgi:hypothetical protein